MAPRGRGGGADGDAPHGARCGVYVYYRVPRPDAPRWLAQAAAMQADVAARAAPLATRLMRRVAAADGAGGDTADALTLMEVYEASGGQACARRLADTVAAEAARRPWPSPRHVEVFVDASDPPPDA